MLNLGFLSFFVFSFNLSLFYLIFSIYFLFLKAFKTEYLNLEDVSGKKKRMLSSLPVPLIFFSFYRYTFFFILFFLITFRSFNTTFFFRHISFESFNFSIYFILVLFFFFLSILFENIFAALKHVQLSLDFFTALWLFFTIAPFCVFSNTLLTFFFFLELGSLLTFYILISAKDIFVSGTIKRGGSSGYFSSVFFQFWASFFSSVILMYSIIMFFFLFGTTEWVFLNFFIERTYSSGSFLLKSQVSLVVYLFIFAILIKMGVSPFLLFKIEIYRSLPLIVLFFYSIIYFFFFFALVFLVFLYYFFSIFFLVSIPFFFLLCFSTFFLIGNLFNLYLLKNFFALSSLVNSLSFFFLIFSYSI